MAPRVEIAPADAEQPVSAPRDVARRSLASTPRGRAVTLGVLAHSLQPGLAPCPWTVTGTLEAIEQLGMRVESVVLLGDIAAAETIFERGARGHAVHQLSLTARPAGPRQRLHIQESQRPASVPTTWIGTNFVCVAPLAHRQGRPPKTWFGPCEHAMQEVGHLLGYDAPTDPSVRAAGRLVSEVFASSTTVVDAHWWSAADVDGALCSEPAAPSHVLAAAIGEPFGHGAVDAWLAGLLNLRTVLHAHADGRAGQREGHAVISVGGRRGPWPAVRLELSEALDTARRRGGRTPGMTGMASMTGAVGGLAGRAVQALWRNDAPTERPGRGSKRLAPPITGPFADHWRAFRSVDLEHDAPNISSAR